jgi:hypothetical protein
MRAALLLALLALAGCAPGPPKELDGLWSSGPAACSAGIGLRFGADEIAAVYDADRTETLFANPRYETMHVDGRFRVRITYEAPLRPGGARSGVRGVLVMERRNDGWLRPISHRFEDARTGAVRLPIGQDQNSVALSVRPCASDAWISDLRGRGT